VLVRNECAHLCARITAEQCARRSLCALRVQAAFNGAEQRVRSDRSFNEVSILKIC